MTNINKNNPLDNSCEYIKKSFELKNLKLYKEAIEMLYKALCCEDSDVPNIEIIAQIGDLYLLLKNYDRAIEEYGHVLEIEPLHNHTLFQLCEIYFLQKRYNEALDLIEEVCKNSKKTINFIKYFQILYKLEKFDKIAQIYDSLDKKSQDNEEILYIMSLSCKNTRRAFLDKIIAQNKEHLDAHFDLGVLDFEQNKLDDAKVHFEFVIKNQKNAAAHDYLGLIYQKQGLFNKAIEHFYLACKIDKAKGEYFFNLAKAYIDVFWFDEAQVAIQKSLKLAQFQNSKVDLGEQYYTLAWINWQRKNFKNALLNISLVEENSEFFENAKILKNIIELNLGDIASAKIKLEKLFETNPDNPDLISALGQIYRELKMYDKCIKIYENGLQIYTDSFEYLSSLIDALIDAKSYAKAFKYAHKFHAMHPKSADIHNSYARIHYRQKEYKEALRELEEVIKLDQNNAEAYYFTGLILNDTQKPKNALEKLEIALELSPLKSKYYAQMGRSYALLGNFKDALLFIKEAIDIEPQEINYMKTAGEYCKILGEEADSRFYQNQAKMLENVLKHEKTKD